MLTPPASTNDWQRCSVQASRQPNALNVMSAVMGIHWDPILKYSHKLCLSKITQTTWNDQWTLALRHNKFWNEVSAWLIEREFNICQKRVIYHWIKLSKLLLIFTVSSYLDSGPISVKYPFDVLIGAIIQGEWDSHFFNSLRMILTCHLQF